MLKNKKLIPIYQILVCKMVFQSKHDARFFYSHNIADIDGNWGSWTSYSACPVTCGNGDRVRTRQCNNPAQSGKGLNCVGPASEVLVCSLYPCAVGKKTLHFFLLNQQVF